MTDSRRVRYRISFYEPGSKLECADFDADTPFQAVSVGDELLGMIWKDSAEPLPGKFDRQVVARVTKVHRSVSAVGNEIYDTTLVYCDDMKD
jgi:hypothetical protein